MVFNTAHMEPETASLLRRVYEEACRLVGVDEKPSEPSWNSDRRMSIGAAILDLARSVVKDPEKLKAFAVKGFVLPRK